MNKKLLKINTVANFRYMGHISEGIGLTAMQNGIESCIAYARWAMQSSTRMIRYIVWATYGINIFSFFFHDTKQLTGFAMMEPGLLAGVIAFIPVEAALCSVFGKGFVRWRQLLTSAVQAVSMSAILTCLMNGDRNISGHRTFFMIKSIGELSSDQTIDTIGRSNLSTCAFAKNLRTAPHSPDRIIGTGLGTHESNHDVAYSNITNNEFYFLNRQDGYSLLIRIFSEFGIVGLIVVLFFFVRWYNPKNLINFSVSFILIVFFIRYWHYVSNWTLLFVMFYYFTFRFLSDLTEQGMSLLQTERSRMLVQS